MITDWLTSIGTIGAVVIAIVLALWGEQIRLFGSRAHFEVLFERKPPDCQLIGYQAGTAWATTFLLNGAAVRFRVDKSGISAATNVEVRILRTWQADERGAFQQDRDFLPANLKWTESDTITTRVIHPGLPKHCEFMQALQPSDGEKLTFFFQTAGTRDEVRTGVNPYIKGPGRYRIEIGVSSDDMRPLRKMFEVDFTGEWSDDPEAMFGKELVVSLL